MFDTGSVDDTWDIVRDVASRDDRVRLLGRDPVYFSETRLRAWMFHQARAHMRDGDWFLRVDADEFHHVPPPEFVRTRLAPHETIVFHQYYDFRLTAAEVRGVAGGQGDARRSRPPDRGAPALLHRERVQRAAPVPLPRDHALAADRLVSVQRRLSRPRAPADPPLPAPRPGPARAALPAARGDDGGRREPASLVAPGRASLVAKRLAKLHRARRSPRPALLAAGVPVARVPLHQPSRQAALFAPRSACPCLPSAGHSTACALGTPTPPIPSESRSRS